MAIIKHSYAEVINLTAKDVHPPLYYLILKIIVDGVRALVPEISVIYVAKLVSVIPYIILMLVFATKVHKEWGYYVAGTGEFGILAMSNLINYGVEIRMYSFSVLFVTLTYLYIYDVVKRDGFCCAIWNVSGVYTLFCGACYSNFVYFAIFD